MAGDNPTRQLIDDGQKLMDNSKRVLNDAHQVYDKIRGSASPSQFYQDNPFAVVAAAAGVGYLLGGGLFTPFTRRILRIGLKGLIIPIAGSQLKHLSSEHSSSSSPSTISYAGGE
jgi:hypothetical protein